MDATTTALFTAAGVDPSTVQTFLSTVFGQGLHFFIYMMEYVWPFILIIGLVLFFWRLAASWARHR